MILTGQYDSPFLRRVAVSLPLLGFARRHDTRSVFGAHRRALYPGRRRHGCAGNRDRSARILEARPAPITTACMLRYLQMTAPAPPRRTNTATSPPSPSTANPSRNFRPPIRRTSSIRGVSEVVLLSKNELLFLKRAVACRAT
jgi:hypothetical protein